MMRNIICGHESKENTDNGDRQCDGGFVLRGVEVQWGGDWPEDWGDAYLWRGYH